MSVYRFSVSWRKGMKRAIYVNGKLVGTTWVETDIIEVRNLYDESDLSAIDCFPFSSESVIAIAKSLLKVWRKRNDN